LPRRRRAVSDQGGEIVGAADGRFKYAACEHNADGN
jgi:hypothetical protein